MSKTLFERLPNELIVEIFSLIELSQLHRAFGSLNRRFDSLLFHRFLRLSARLRRPLFAVAVRSAALLERLELIDWPSADVLTYLRTNAFPRLTSLRIEALDNSYFGPICHELIDEILAMRTLSVCQLQLAPTIFLRLSPSFTVSTSIRSLSLTMITVDSLLHLLARLPELRTLNAWLNVDGERRENPADPSAFRHENLRHLALLPHNDFLFKEIFFFLSHVPRLKSLKVSGAVWDSQFLQPQPWRQIVTRDEIVPELTFLAVQLQVRCSDRQAVVVDLLRRFRRDGVCRHHFKVNVADGLWFHIDCRSYLL